MSGKVNVIGLGYIGLPTALMLAANGVNVVGTDYNSALVEKLIHGQVTFEEDGLPELFRRALSLNIKFQTEYTGAETYIISVPTPYDKQSKKIDPSYVQKAVESVLDAAPKGAVIVIESTVSPGTVDKFIRPVITSRGLALGEDIHLVHAPERIIPGNMIYELEFNSRTIGADSIEIGERAKALYASFCKGEIVITDIRTAEMTKVVENTYRDINIAFANELCKICRFDGLDVNEIIRVANMHPRVNILSPGPGVGGHCISVDPWFLVGDYPGLANIILSARKINDSMPEFVLERISQIKAEHGITDNARIGIYGLTYKENIDDTRESPTLQMLEIMESHLAGGVKVYDPYANKQIVPGQVFSFDEFIGSVDIVVIMVAHNEIKEKMGILEDKIILDTRNVCDFDGVYRL